MRAAFPVRNLIDVMYNIRPQAELLYPVDNASRIPDRVDEKNGGFAKGFFLLSVLSIELWLIWDVIVKKNLLPFETSLSTHMLPCIRETRALRDGQAEPRIPESSTHPPGQTYRK